MTSPSPDSGVTPTAGAGARGHVGAAFDCFVNYLTHVLFVIAGVSLVAMLLLVLGDVLGIKILSHPVPAGIEIATFCEVVAVAFAVARTQFLGGHVAVDFIIGRIPGKPKTAIEIFTTFLSLCLFAVLTYYMFRYAVKLKAANEVSMTARIPFYPFVYSVGFCFAVVFVVLVNDFVKLLARLGHKWNRQPQVLSE